MLAKLWAIICSEKTKPKSYPKLNLGLKQIQVVLPKNASAKCRPLLVYCWSTVYDAGPTLNQHWFKVPCLLGRQCLVFAGIVSNCGAMCLAPRSRQGWGFHAMSNHPSLSPPTLWPQTHPLAPEAPIYDVCATRTFYKQASGSHLSTESAGSGIILPVAGCSAPDTDLKL